MESSSVTECWAHEEFADSALGDRRRTLRLIAMAQTVQAQPRGSITGTFEEPAQREAAFRWVENQAIAVTEITAASARAGARRCVEYSFVFVPVDGTAMSIVDCLRRKDIGLIGAHNKGGRGVQTMTAMLVAPTGTPMGIGHQTFWARRGRKRPGGKFGGRKDRRQLRSRETRHWIETMTKVTATLAKHAPTTQPWFQLDRGGDSWEVLGFAHRLGALATVRASADRRLWTERDQARRYLRAEMARLPIGGHKWIDVPARSQRQARRAKLAVRFAHVELDLHDPRGTRRERVPLWAVHVREVGTTPADEQPLDWMLLTTFAVDGLADAELVIHGYATRWAIEEFHKTWKSDACNVEAMQLRSFANICRWAAVLAAVAMRIQRLMKLARHEPDLPATIELTKGEVRAIIVSTRHQKMTAKAGDMLTIGEAVKWLGSLGGHSPAPSAGPPGAKTLMRGLERITLLAAHFDEEL